MNLTQLVEVLAQNALVHDREAAAFEQQVERGNDVFESTFAQKYHEGCTDTYRAVAAALHRMQAHGEILPEAFKAAIQASEDLAEEFSEDRWADSIHAGPCIA